MSSLLYAYLVYGPDSKIVKILFTMILIFNCKKIMYFLFDLLKFNYRPIILIVYVINILYITYYSVKSTFVFKITRV